MKRKIIIIFSVVLCLNMFGLAYASDLGSSDECYDETKLITFSIKPHRYNADINGEICFNLIIENNSDDKCYVKYLSRVFKGYESPTITIDEEIPPHDTLEVSVSTTLNNTADWYKDGDSYYLDYNMRLNYSLYNANRETYSTYYSYQTNKARLLINNLYDASDLVLLSCTDETKETYLVEDITRYYSYSGSVENDIKVEVAVNYNLQDFTVYNNTFCHYQPTLIFYEKLELDNFPSHHYFTKLSRVYDLQTYSTKAIWNTDGNYYISVLEETYPVKKLIMPEINITQEHNTTGYTIKIYNNSNKDIENLYLDYSTIENESVTSDSNALVIPIIKKNKFYEIESETRLFKSNSEFIIGTKFDDYAALWKVTWYTSYDGTEFMADEEYLGYVNIAQELNPTPVPVVTPTATVINANTPTTTHNSSIPAFQQGDIRIISFVLFGIIIVLIAIIITILSNYKKKKNS